MRRLVVLGNGFDLFCGLKTSFRSFYNNCKKDFETPFGVRSNCNFVFFLIYQTFKNENEKIKLAFQNTLNINNDEDWLDIELLLKNFITGECFDVANCAFHFSKTLDRSDLLYFTLCSYFHERHLGIQERQSFEYFLNCELVKFEKMLAEYIRKEQMSNITYVQQANSLMGKLCNRGDEYGLITFNYTTFVPDNKPNRLIHVHGSIDDNIIIGIDKTNLEIIEPSFDEYGEITDKTLFTKTRRILSYLSLGQTRSNALKKDVEIITFYGHSLGEQDYSYFQSIFDFYDIYGSNIVLEFCFSEYCKELGNEFEADRTSTRVFRLIEKYGETINNKDHGKNLVHKMLLENRLRIRRID